MNKETTANQTLLRARTPCETWSRSMGYIRPITNFNIGKRQEFEERNTFKEENCITAGFRHTELMKKAA